MLYSIDFLNEDSLIYIYGKTTTLHKNSNANIHIADAYLSFIHHVSNYTRKTLVDESYFHIYFC